MSSKPTFLMPQPRGHIDNKQIEERNKIIHSVNTYDIFFHLKKDNYNGRVTISLDFNEVALKKIHNQSFLLIEYEGQAVHKISVEKESDIQDEIVDEKVIEFTFDSHIISIKMSNIQPFIQKSLKNFKLNIFFENIYSKVRAEGMVKYEQGNNDYIYCQGEVACTNWVFPCIDSVNFRSNYQIKIQHPSKWIVSSHKKVSNQEKLINDEIITTFPIIDISFPTYLFGLYSGDYYRYQSVYRDEIELNIYCRQEYKDILDKQVDEYFKKIKFAMNFMEQYTDVKYYLDKFDVFFCPFYKDVGMETLGCISLDEEVYLEDHCDSDLVQKFIEMSRTDTLFHEIVHQWFGNYMSIKWWNDLFIKEGFANFFTEKIIEEYFSKIIAVRFLNEIKQFDYFNLDIESKFNIIHKKLPYDKYVSLQTHNNVTYQKSCSILCMLENKIYGKDKFQVIIQNILKDNINKSISSEDFLKYFDDSVTQKYLTSKGCVFFEKQNIIKPCSNGTLLFNKEELDVLNLTVFVINKKDLSYKLTSYNELKDLNTDSYIYILNTYDNHLIYQSIDRESIDFIDENKLMDKFDEGLRASIWKSLFFKFKIDEWDYYINTFFINNILYEKNDSIFHTLIYKFTTEDETLITSKVEFAQTEHRQNIMIYYSIRQYVKMLSNLKIIRDKYSNQFEQIGKGFNQFLNNKIQKTLW